MHFHLPHNKNNIKNASIFTSLSSCLQRLQSLVHVQEEMAARDKTVADLEGKLEETSLLLQHSKRAFRQELDKNKVRRH